MEYSMHAILLGDFSAFADKIYCWFLRCDFENVGSPLKLKKNSVAPFYGWGSTASRLHLLRGDSLLFTIKFPEIPGTHFIHLGKMKGCVDLEATQWF